MKRYLLFAGEKYYPGGGAYDFRDSFDTIEAAKDAPLATTSWGSYADWAHIADRDDALRIIWHYTAPGSITNQHLAGWKEGSD